MSNEKVVKAQDIFNKFNEMKEKYEVFNLDVRTSVIPVFVQSNNYFTSDIHTHKSDYFHGKDWPDYSVTIGSTLGIFQIYIPLNNAESDEGKFEMEYNDRLGHIYLTERIEKGQEPNMAIYLYFRNDH